MRNIDTKRLTALRRRNLSKRNGRYFAPASKGLDTGRLTALNPRHFNRPRFSAGRGLDTRRLTALHNPRHFNRPMIARPRMDTTRLTALRRNLEPYSTTAYRYNPDMGPELYNPLEDDNHEFKDDSHYEATISKLRRNPDDCEYCPDCGLRRNPEEGSGLFRSLYSRNPDYALRGALGVNTATGDPGQGLYRSLFARRNPPSSIQTASNDLIGQGLYKSIFSRNPIRRWKRRR